jgi:hypothetical protein
VLAEFNTTDPSIKLILKNQSDKKLNFLDQYTEYRIRISQYIENPQPWIFFKITAFWDIAPCSLIDGYNIKKFCPSLTFLNRHFTVLLFEFSSNHTVGTCQTCTSLIIVLPLFAFHRLLAWNPLQMTTIIQSNINVMH